MNKYAFIFFFFFCGSIYMYAQSKDYISVKPTLLEFGVGYPISLTNYTTRFDAFFNVGFQRPISEKYFMGLLISPQFRISSRWDYSLGSKIRIGRLVSENHNISLGLGYAFYSGRHKAFPGLALDINFDKTNDYGFHIKYEVFNYETTTQERNLIVGIHLTNGKAAKIGLPVIGAAGGIIGFFAYIISQSR